MVLRYNKVKVRALNEHGEEIEREAEELEAFCFQHEIDHLNGVLFIDRLSRLKRELFLRWLKKSAEITGETFAGKNPTKF